MKKKKGHPSQFEYVVGLNSSTRGAEVKYDGDTRAGGDGNDKFWNDIAKRLETECYWNGCEKIIDGKASIVEVGIIKIVILDYKINREYYTRITHIVTANGKTFKWVDEPDKPEAEAWIVRCYLRALSDQLVHLSAKNAVLLGYKPE